MNATDYFISIVLAIVAATPGLLALRGQQRKLTAEASLSDADTAGKYKDMLNEEIERRKKAEMDADNCRVACGEATEMAKHLKEEVNLLKKQLYALGIKPVGE